MSDPALNPPPIAVPVRRIPHLGHAALLCLLYLAGLACAVIAIVVVMYLHLFGVSTDADARHSIVVALGSTAINYAVTLGAGALVFSILWRQGILTALQWNASAARRLWWRLLVVAAASFGLNLLLSRILHFPAKTPMSDLLTTPQAWWAMFAFGITLGPFAEEIIFRGFLLPAFSTAWDWTGEKLAHRPPRPLGPNAHPSWSLAAMIFGSLAATFLFALAHAAQNGWAWGPLLAVSVGSFILCAVRLATRSLAASTITHAAYNFTLFVVTLIRTHGFQNLHH
jgi:hypothetical protein